MVDWYKRLHVWNRLILIALFALLVTSAIFGTRSIERIIGAPLAAVLIWAVGWAAIGAWRSVSNTRSLRRSGNRARTRNPSNFPNTAPVDEKRDTPSWRERYEAAYLAMDYRKDVRDAWSQVAHLPDHLKEKFLVQLNSNPKMNVSEIVIPLIMDYKRESAPFDDPKLSHAYAEAKKLGYEAANEFVKAVELLGNTVEPDELLKSIRKKFPAQEHVMPVEIGSIGGYEYVIDTNDCFLIKLKDGSMRSFSSQQEAMEAFGISRNAKKRIKYSW